jgi:predicted Rossmann-fold nucleotide-binding protein
MGPYEEGLSLKELFTKSSGLNYNSETTIPQEGEFVRLNSDGLNSSVYLTKDWAERQNGWNKDYIGILVTENDLKHWENDHPLSHTVFALETKKMFIAGPDSIEAEATAIDIARGKVIIGLMDPVQDATTRELKEALDAIGAKDAKHVVVLSEDREMIMPKILKEASVWDNYRDLPLVKECFAPGEAFPGKRFNELQNAVGGVLNYVDLIFKAKEEMRGKGYELPDTHKSYVSYYMRFLEYDPSQPFPEDGVFITASEKNRRLQPLSQKHIDMEGYGKQWDMNDFDVPADYHGILDDKGDPRTIENLRADPNSRYFSSQFSSARAMRAFARVINIPKLDKPRTYEFHDIPSAKLVSNLSIGEFAQLPDGADEIGNYHIASNTHRIESHEDLEHAFLHGEGTIVEQWPDINSDNPLYELERKLIARMVISNRATVKPLADSSALGRPFLIDYGVSSNEMANYHNGVKFRTITSRSEHVFRCFSDIDSFNSVMEEGQWDTKHMRPMPKPQPYYLISRKELEDKTGHKLGFSEALLGSASSHSKSGNDDAYTYTYESAKKTITLVHGGGGRFIMGQFFAGAIDAMKDGYSEFLNIACRVPLASRKEGSLKRLLRDNNFEAENGDFESDYMSFGDDHFHSMTFNFMGERQHGIIAPAHLVTSFIGGVGTEYEFVMSMYHNLMVEMRGYGIFPGFNNTEKKRIHFVSSEVKNGADNVYGFYDALRKSLTPDQWEILNTHFYATPEAAMKARYEYAAELGYDLDAPRYDEGQNIKYELVAA